MKPRIRKKKKPVTQTLILPTLFLINTAHYRVETRLGIRLDCTLLHRNVTQLKNLYTEQRTVCLWTHEYKMPRMIIRRQHMHQIVSLHHIIGSLLLEYIYIHVHYWFTRYRQLLPATILLHSMLFSPTITINRNEIIISQEQNNECLYIENKYKYPLYQSHVNNLYTQGKVQNLNPNERRER